LYLETKGEHVQGVNGFKFCILESDPWPKTQNSGMFGTFRIMS